jgi:excisionase family DNA binding protein
MSNAEEGAVNNQEPGILTADEVANQLRVSLRTVYRLIDNGQIEAFRVGGQWRITRVAITEYMRRNSTLGSTKAQPPDDVPAKDDGL